MSGLVARGLTKRFPGTLALDGVDLDVPSGQVVVLLGENGAGKSTLVKIIAGVHIPDGGSMELDGAPYAPADPGDAIAHGITMIHQEMTLLPGLSVAENIHLGRLPQRRGAVDYPAMRDATRRALDRVGLDLDPDTPVRRLAVAQQQLVEIAKALSMRAGILILDEPTAALGDADTERLFGIVDELKTQDVGFVYISHRLEEVPVVGDQVVVMRDGQRVAHHDHADVPTGDLVRAMVGRAVEDTYPTPPQAHGDVVLEVDGLARDGAFRDVSFTLRRGEILGIAGLVGAGRTEVVRALFGAEPPDRGTMTLDGEPYAPADPAEAVAAGVVLVPEDRKAQGVVLDLSLADNLALPSLDDLGPVVTPAEVTKLAERESQRLDIKGRPGQAVSTLSGGNQQKAVIAKWLARSPRILIFDEPTRGVDVGAKRGIHDLVRGLAADGVAVIVVSSDLPEVLGLSNRVLVMARGRQSAIVDRADADEETVMTHAIAQDAP